MAAHILQVAYYPTLQKTRALILKSAGYEVTSVLGNDQATGVNGALIAAVDVIVIGFCAPHAVRSAIVLWFKAHYPKIPIVALLASMWETFPEAEVSTFSEDPNIWLAGVASILSCATDEAAHIAALPVR